MSVIYRKIHPERPSELSQFSLLMGQLAQPPQDSARLKTAIEAINARTDAYLAVAYDEDHDQLCGSVFAQLYPDLCGDMRPDMVVENVVTLDKYRRRGIGTGLFAEIERWGRSENVRYIILCSSLKRIEAHPFYTKIGYEEIKGFKKVLE